jgi:hypothetical protein
MLSVLLSFSIKEKISKENEKKLTREQNGSDQQKQNNHYLLGIRN